VRKVRNLKPWKHQETSRERSCGGREERICGEGAHREVAGAAPARRRGGGRLSGLARGRALGLGRCVVRLAAVRFGKGSSREGAGEREGGRGASCKFAGLKSGAERGGACGAANDHVAPPGLFVCGLDSMG
jgi:hypothetical protein